MYLLLTFLAMCVVTGLLFWQLTRQRSYRVKNRDRLPGFTSKTTKERSGPNWSDMLD